MSIRVFIMSIRIFIMSIRVFIRYTCGNSAHGQAGGLRRRPPRGGYATDRLWSAAWCSITGRARHTRARAIRSHPEPCSGCSALGHSVTRICVAAFGGVPRPSHTSVSRTHYLRTMTFYIEVLRHWSLRPKGTQGRTTTPGRSPGSPKA